MASMEAVPLRSACALQLASTTSSGGGPSATAALVRFGLLPFSLPILDQLPGAPGSGGASSAACGSTRTKSLGGGSAWLQAESCNPSRPMASSESVTLDIAEPRPLPFGQYRQIIAGVASLNRPLWALSTPNPLLGS